MTWDAYHRRKDLLREIFAIADREPDTTLSDLLDAVDPQRSVLEDEVAALFEIQMAWFQRLNGHVDRLAAEGGETPALVAVAAWVATAADLPGARALLDAHQDAPELATAFAKERTFLAASAGVPFTRADLGDQGDRIIAAARADVADLPSRADGLADDAAVERPSTPWSLLDRQRHHLIARLRSVIAA